MLFRDQQCWHFIGVLVTCAPLCLPLVFFMVFHDFVDGRVLTVKAGRDEEVIALSKWNRGPAPFCSADNFTYRWLVPSRPAEKISPVAFCRPVPSRKSPLTVSSRRQNLPLRSRPGVKTSPYRPVPPSKTVPTVPPRHSLPSLLPVKKPRTPTAIN